MNTDQIIDFGLGLARSPEVRAAVRKLASKIPASALAVAGVGGTSGLAIAGGALGVFIVGAAAGASIVLLMGPGGDERRVELARRMTKLRDKIVDASRRSAREGGRTPIHVTRLDDTLIPRA